MWAHLLCLASRKQKPSLNRLCHFAFRAIGTKSTCNSSNFLCFIFVSWRFPVLSWGSNRFSSVNILQFFSVFLCQFSDFKCVLHFALFITCFVRRIFLALPGQTGFDCPAFASKAGHLAKTHSVTKK